MNIVVVLLVLWLFFGFAAWALVHGAKNLRLEEMAEAAKVAAERAALRPDPRDEVFDQEKHAA